MKLRTWGVFLRQFDGSWRLLAVSVGLSLVQAALLFPVALIVRRVFDRVIPHHDAATLAVDGALIIALYLGSAAVGLLTRYAVLVSARQAIGNLRIALLEAVYRHPRSYFDRRSLTALHGTVVQDSERLDLVANALAASVIPATIVALGLSVVMLVMNALLFGVLLAVVPVVIVLGRLLGRSVRTRYQAWQRAFDTFSGETQLALRAVTLTRVSGAERAELEQRRDEVWRLSQAKLEVTWRQSIYTLIQGAVAVSAGVVVLIVGGRSVAHGDMTLGRLLAFYAVVALLLRQVDLILSELPKVIGGYESIARMEEVLRADEPEPYTGSRQIAFEGGLSLEDVSFAYGDEPVLRDVSLAIAPGEQISIVGPNGAGKSTLLRLMMGLYRPVSGRLSADGVPYDELDLRSLRHGIGVLLQEPLIFPRTVRENIAYGRPQATGSEVRAAARWATAEEFIERLPQRYETPLGDDGGLLSGGQRQRIAVARALLAHPRLLILDEPTTHLDDPSIHRLLAHLRTFPGAPAVVTITHDAEVARSADRVYHLRDGRIVAGEGVEPASVPPVRAVAGR